MKKPSLDNYSFGIYLIPLLLSTSIMIVIEGSFVHISSGLKYEGVSARVIGLVALLISLGMMYDILFEIPSKIGGHKLSQKVRKLFFSSPFFVLLFIDSIFPEVMKSLGLSWRFLFWALLLLTIIFQKKFLDKYRILTNQK
jgi:hypothetical protein